MTSVWQKQRSRVHVKRTRLRRRLTHYFYSGWKPAAVCLGLLLLLMLVGAMNETALLSSSYLSTVLSAVCVVGVAIAFFGLVASTVWNLVNKRWIRSTLSLCLLVGISALLNMAIANLFLFAADDAAMENTVTHIPAEVIERVEPVAKGSGTDSIFVTKNSAKQREQIVPGIENNSGVENDQNDVIQEMPAGLENRY